MSRDAGAKTILFVSCASTLYGGERSLLDIVNVMSPTWRPWFVVPEIGPYSVALDELKYRYDVTPVPRLPTRHFDAAALRLAVDVPAQCCRNLTR